MLYSPLIQMLNKNMRIYFYNFFLYESCKCTMRHRNEMLPSIVDVSSLSRGVVLSYCFVVTFKNTLIHIKGSVYHSGIGSIST